MTPTQISIQAVHESDSSNYEITKRGLGKSCQIPENIVRLYDLVNSCIGPKLSTVRDRVSLTLAAPQNMKHLVVGTNSLYCLYASQMYREVRSAVEATGIAWLIHNDPAKYEIFVNDRGLDTATRKAAKEAFKAWMIFPDTQPSLIILRKHYDEASMKAHTTFRGFMSHLSLPPGDAVSQFSMYDVKPATAHQTLPGNLSWMCQAHLDIIETVVKVIFPDEFDLSYPGFQDLWMKTATLNRLMHDWAVMHQPS
jgi:hypothetical protein